MHFFRKPFEKRARFLIQSDAAERRIWQSFCKGESKKFYFRKKFEKKLNIDKHGRVEKSIDFKLMKQFSGSEEFTGSKKTITNKINTWNLNPIITHFWNLSRISHLHLIKLQIKYVAKNFNFFCIYVLNKTRGEKKKYKWTYFFWEELSLGCNLQPCLSTWHLRVLAGWQDQLEYCAASVLWIQMSQCCPSSTHICEDLWKLQMFLHLSYK